MQFINLAFIIYHQRKIFILLNRDEGNKQETFPSVHLQALIPCHWDIALFLLPFCAPNYTQSQSVTGRTLFPDPWETLSKAKSKNLAAVPKINKAETRERH